MPATLEHLLEVVLAKEKELSEKRGQEVRIFMCTSFFDSLDFKLRTFKIMSFEDEGCLFMRDFDEKDPDRYCLGTVEKGGFLFPYGFMYRPFYLVKDWLLTAMAFCSMPDFNHSEEELVKIVILTSFYCTDLWVDSN